MIKTFKEFMSSSVTFEQEDIDYIDKYMSMIDESIFSEFDVNIDKFKKEQAAIDEIFKYHLLKFSMKLSKFGVQLKGAPNTEYKGHTYMVYRSDKPIKDPKVFEEMRDFNKDLLKGRSFTAVILNRKNYLIIAYKIA